MMDAIGEILARVLGAFPLRAVGLMLAALVLAGGAGFLTAAALGVGSQDPTRTVTIDLATGPTGPAGPAGPTGPRGPAGGSGCPAGYTAGKLVINHPGGQVAIWTCLED